MKFVMTIWIILIVYLMIMGLYIPFFLVER